MNIKLYRVTTYIRIYRALRGKIKSFTEMNKKLYNGKHSALQSMIIFLKGCYYHMDAGGESPLVIIRVM